MRFPFETIDTHVHLYPDSIAVKVTSHLSKRFGNAPSFDGTVSGCEAKNAEGGFDIAINLPVATKPDSVRHTNEFWRRYAPKGRAFGHVVSLACFHPRVPDKTAELAWIAEAGFTGVKFHPEYQLFRLDDPEMDETWQAMSDLGLVAYLHAGGERVFSPPYHSCPSDIAELKRRFPALKIAAAHLGGFDMWDEAERTLVGQDVYLDLSHCFGWVGEDQIVRMIEKHGFDRILLGSDAPWQDPATVLAAFLALPFTADQRRAILHDNAARLLLAI